MINSEKIDPIISIIVPVYKVEIYIRRCIESILKQTFTNFELILVDDGSPDNCPAICDEYAARDHRIRVIHKSNGGLSSARNAGMQIARGKYIMFVDSDDYVHKDWCKTLLQSLIDHPDAWVVSNIFRTNSAGDCSIVVDSTKVSSASLSYYDVFKMGLSPYVWNKIYDLMKIRHIGLQFDEHCFYGEDIAFNVKYYTTCSEIAYIPDPLYFYVQNDSGIMSTYRANLFELNLPHFSVRLPLIREHEMAAFCDTYLYYFLGWLENTKDSRNTMPLWEKMEYNHQMMNTEEFQYCVENATGKNDSKLFMMIVRLHNYYIYWLFQKVCAIKSRLKRIS